MLDTRDRRTGQGSVIHRDVVESVASVLIDTPTATRVAETFRVLGDPTRARIVHALSLSELCTCDLAALLGMSEPTVSHHLRTLRQMHIVRFRREGRLVYYALDDDHIRHLFDDSLEHASEA